MTVKELIRCLKKMPPDGRVVFADHDHNHEGGEYNGPVSFVAEASEKMKERGYDVVIW